MLFAGFLIVLAILAAGCTAPGTTPQPDDGTAAPITASMNAAVNTSSIPLILTDDQWKMAYDCGWTKENISETAALFQDSCRVKMLVSDGWTIEGIGYDMNFLGSRCRTSTHPDAPKDCDWCPDAGPTLSLRYHGIMTAEYMANMVTKTVTHYSTNLPEGAGSASYGDTDTIRYRNGTVLYVFRNCT
jgi:hypothetical protein